MSGSALEITPTLSVPFSEFELSYARSSGPGGQNVNKVNSKAVLRWNIQTSPSIGPFDRVRLLEKLASRLTSQGEIVIACDTQRDQIRNREECYERLQALVAQALHREKVRKKTKISKTKKNKNLDSKKKHSQKKQMRRSDY